MILSFCFFIPKFCICKLRRFADKIDSIAIAVAFDLFVLYVIIIIIVQSKGDFCGQHIIKKNN